MTPFARALERIEELLKRMEDLEPPGWDRAHNQLRELLDEHAEEIVQLGKVAENMRAAMEHLPDLLSDLGYTVAANDVIWTREEYDRLIEGDDE